MADLIDNGANGETHGSFQSIQYGNVTKEQAKAEQVAIQNRANDWMSGGSKIHVQVHADGDITAHNIGPTILTSSDVFGSDTTGVMSTCVSKTGRPLTLAEIKPDSIITIQGQQLTVELAHRLGFIGLSSDGKYYDPNAAMPKAQTAEQRTAPQRAAAEAKAEADAGFSLMDDEVADHLEALFRHHGVDDETAIAIITKAIGSILVDGPGAPVCKEMASLCNMEVKQAAEILSAIVTHLANNASILTSRLLADRGRKYTAQQVFDFLMSCGSGVRSNLGVRFLHKDPSAVIELRDRMMTGYRQ